MAAAAAMRWWEKGRTTCWTSASTLATSERKLLLCCRHRCWWGDGIHQIPNHTRPTHLNREAQPNQPIGHLSLITTKRKTKPQRLVLTQTNSRLNSNSYIDWPVLSLFEISSSRHLGPVHGTTKQGFGNLSQTGPKWTLFISLLEADTFLGWRWNWNWKKKRRRSLRGCQPSSPARQ